MVIYLCVEVDSFSWFPRKLTFMNLLRLGMVGSSVMQSISLPISKFLL